MEDKADSLLTAEQISSLTETINIHQFNENAIRHTRSLSDLLGLTQIGVHLVRLETGFESTQFHFHHNDEEFLYILSGKGIAVIGDEEYEIAVGDFMAFGQKSFPHMMRN
ncbi:MAG: cupin domain-containing protein, partial [bacterium]